MYYHKKLSPNEAIPKNILTHKGREYFFISLEVPSGIEPLYGVLQTPA